MHFSNLPSELVPPAIAGRLVELCNTQPQVAWLVSGGSNIAVQVAALQLLQETGVDLTKITIMLNDERFGEIGHVDSNWHQLEQAGFMVEGPQYIPAFTEHETTLTQAVQRYEDVLTEIMAQHYVFSQLGMGDDGHIAGILPGSSAAADYDGFVHGYEAAPYQRLTTTFTAIHQFDEVALVAYGESKWPQLRQLGSAVSPQDVPAQVLTTIAKATIYTDYVE